MGSDLIVITRIASQDPTLIRLSQDTEAVRALAGDRPDQPCGESVPPRRGERNRLVPYAHGAQSTRDDSVEDSIPIADEVAWSLIPRERFCDLTRNLFRCRMSCGVDPDKIYLDGNHEQTRIPTQL